MRITKQAIALLVVALVQVGIAKADTFGSGENQFEIPFVTIGSPGNAPDTTGAPNPAGGVSYTYRIGKYEVPEEAIRKANALSELAGEPLGITLDDRGPQKPATGVSWFEAARFVNWLNEEKGFAPAYKFDTAGAFQLWAPGDPGYNPSNLFRNAHARYVLPSVDEWYKAAFYDPAIGDYWDYPTGSNDPPTPVAFGTEPGTAVYEQLAPANVSTAGGESRYGTVGQAGNVWEWDETEGDLTNNLSVPSRGNRGSDWLSVEGDPISLSSSYRSTILSTGSSNTVVGFRVATLVPEPTSASLVLTVLSSAQIFFRRNLLRRG